MSDPFRLAGPAGISFSTGRTSGYMLRRILDAHGGSLPPNVHVLFANTGKEREESLRFGHEIETRWGVPIVWLEYAGKDVPPRVVSFETASRKGEPFELLIAERGYLPNIVARFCHGGTQDPHHAPLARAVARELDRSHWPAC